MKKLLIARKQKENEAIRWLFFPRRSNVSYAFHCISSTSIKLLFVQFLCNRLLIPYLNLQVDIITVTELQAGKEKLKHGISYKELKEQKMKAKAESKTRKGSSEGDKLENDEHKQDMKRMYEVMV